MAYGSTRSILAISARIALRRGFSGWPGEGISDEHAAQLMAQQTVSPALESLRRSLPWWRFWRASRPPTAKAGFLTWMVGLPGRCEGAPSTVGLGAKEERNVFDSFHWRQAGVRGMIGEH